LFRAPPPPRISSDSRNFRYVNFACEGTPFVYGTLDVTPVMNFRQDVI